MRIGGRFEGWPWLITGAWLGADQGTKALVQQIIPPNASVQIIPGFLNLVHVRNRGAAFGVLSQAGGWQVAVLIGIALLATVVFGVWLWSLQGRAPWTRLALAFILAGAMGNLVDRLRFAYVVDFLDFHWKTVFHYPAFNLADSGVIIGVVLIFVGLLRKEEGAFQRG